MVVISRSDVCRAERPAPPDPDPGIRRPIVVVQSDALNRSWVATVVRVPLTSNLRWVAAPENVPLAARMTGLPRNSVANVSQVNALDRTLLEARVGRLSCAKLELLISGLDVVLGR